MDTFTNQDTQVREPVRRSILGFRHGLELRDAMGFCSAT